MTQRRSPEYALGLIRGWYDSVPDDGARACDCEHHKSTGNRKRDFDFQRGYWDGRLLRRGAPLTTKNVVIRY